MKIKPPANENERLALKQRLEREHGARVGIIKGRFGWYARFSKPGNPQKRRGETGQ
jgi:hypothetical protein